MLFLVLFEVPFVLPLALQEGVDVSRALSLLVLVVGLQVDHFYTLHLLDLEFALGFTLWHSVPVGVGALGAALLDVMPHSLRIVNIIMISPLLRRLLPLCQCKLLLHLLIFLLQSAHRLAIAFVLRFFFAGALALVHSFCSMFSAAAAADATTEFATDLLYLLLIRLFHF